MVQFNELIYRLSRNINWDVQVAAVAAGCKLDTQYHPLTVNPDEEHRRSRGESHKEDNNGVSLDQFEKSIRSFVK